jgi:3-phenylpropionate/cinnamic acid dioxygenase small subunit
MSEALVEGFLYGEARLMDEHRYADWLALWADDATYYWVPCNDDDIDPSREVSIIYDDRDRLVQRIDRLISGSVLAQDPKPRMRRLVSNVEITTETGAELSVQSNFILTVAKRDTQQIWAGRSIHRLRRHGESFKIVHKKVLLVNADQEMPLLQFLI